MKLLLAPLLALATAPALTLLDTESTASADRAAVERAMKDYVEAFYEAKPELIARGVSKDMKKMGFWRGGPEESYRGPLHMNFDQATELARTWNADGQQGENLEYEIEIYEVADKTACGKLTAKWGIDYFQLAKEDGEWKAHHILWQSHPPEQGE